MRDFIASQLPRHMIPAFFWRFRFCRFPSRERLDRAALSELDVMSKSESAAQSIPESELERTLAQLWQRI